MAQRVLVTAGAAGIGLANTEAFAASGARVHIVDVNADAVQEVTRGNAAIGGSVGDIGKPPDLDLLFSELQSRLGGLDVLVNNAVGHGLGKRVA
jgi:NAD(P)-dependent dehydrogenase (short-subunit alcohol dehydrogenase family)